MHEAFCTALANCPWQHLDDTGTCLDGVPYLCHVLTSPLGTFFSTRSDKSPWLRGEVRRKVSEVAALADYHAQTEVPVVRMLLTDDAPQFRGITEDHGLCWVHRGRNLKALRPHVCGSTSTAK